MYMLWLYIIWKLYTVQLRLLKKHADWLFLDTVFCLVAEDRLMRETLSSTE